MLCFVRTFIVKVVKTKEIPHFDCGKNTTVLNAKQLTTTFN